MKNKMVVQQLTCVACGVLLVTSSACGPTPKEDAAAFANVTNIVFSDNSGLNDRGEFSVADPESIRLMLSTIQLKRKKSCECGHTYGAIFQKPSAQIHVWICDHCFDVLSGTNWHDYKGARHYEMPKAFYKEFLRNAKARKWNGLPPSGP